MRREEEILRLFPEGLRGLWETAAMQYEKLQEIRLRVNQPVCILLAGRECYVDGKGKVTDRLLEARKVTQKELDETLNHICHYSLYAFSEELKQGFITVEGGHRIGVAGQVILQEEGKVKTIKHIRFMNIRISHQIFGAADMVMRQLYSGGNFLNTLIISPPGCGKTTLLRDIIRQASNGGDFGRGRTVGVVDERSEIGGCYLGIPANDVGIRTDILDSCPKSSGMMMLIRSMAPDIVAIDELGSEEELHMLRKVMACGCKVVATIHGVDEKDIASKGYMKKALEEKLFERILILSRKEGKCQIAKLVSV